ncbi:MAG: flagellar hook assembly protein FlgD [Magnetovibrionaceae bacterium]
MPIIGNSLSATQSNATGTQATQDQQQLEEDLNQFLTLLVTQLQNQDPLDPMDANEFTAQLVAFAGVEQAIHTNSNLETLIGLNQNTQIADMVNYIGNAITAVGDELPLEDGVAQFTYTLDTNAEATTVSIAGPDGTIYYSVDGNTSAGTHAVVWDGKTNGGQQLDDGAYQLIVSPINADREPMDVTTTVTGKVTGAGSENGNVTLSMGSIVVDQADVLAVQEYNVPQLDAEE